MKSFTSVALIFAVIGLSHALAEDKPTYYLHTQLAGEDAVALFKVMHIQPTLVGEGADSYSQKKMIIESKSEGFALGLDCRMRENARSCKVTLKSAVEVASGKTLRASQLFSEALVSALRLEPNAEMGEGWSSFESSGRELGVWCEQVYTPTDLPFYTNCLLRLNAL